MSSQTSHSSDTGNNVMMIQRKRGQVCMAMGLPCGEGSYFFFRLLRFFLAAALLDLVSIGPSEEAKAA